jgi:hypothetical protein
MLRPVSRHCCARRRYSSALALLVMPATPLVRYSVTKVIGAENRSAEPFAFSIRRAGSEPAVARSAGTREGLFGHGDNPALVALLRRALNGDGAEFRVLVPNLTGLFVLGPIAPGFCFFEAVPHLNGNAGRWWRSFK